MLQSIKIMPLSINEIPAYGMEFKAHLYEAATLFICQ